MRAHTVRVHIHHVAWTRVSILLVTEILTICVSMTRVNDVMLFSHCIIFYQLILRCVTHVFERLLRVCLIDLNFP